MKITTITLFKPTGLPTCALRMPCERLRRSTRSLQHTFVVNTQDSVAQSVKQKTPQLGIIKCAGSIPLFATWLSYFFFLLNIFMAACKCLPEIGEKGKKKAIFSFFFDYYPRLFVLLAYIYRIQQNCYKLSRLMYTLPMFTLNINHFSAVIWQVIWILGHFMQFLPLSTWIFTILLTPMLHKCGSPTCGPWNCGI